MKQLSFLDVYWPLVSHIPAMVVSTRFASLVRMGHREDLEQAAALAVWASLVRYRPSRGELGALAWTAAFNGAATLARTLNYQLRVTTAAAEQPEPVGQAEIWPAALLKQAPRNARSLIVRSVLLGQTPTEIAHATRRKSRSAIHRRLQRGLAAMRAAVEAEAA